MEKINFVPPTMSWERPIEEIILDYCESMKNQWTKVKHGGATKSVREGAKNFEMAYDSVAKYIKREIELRKNINEMSKVRKTQSNRR